MTFFSQKVATCVTTRPCVTRPFTPYHNTGTVRYYNDDFCLLTLLQGMCLKYMRSPLQAEECLKTVIGFKGKLEFDTYLVPYAMFEYALLLKDQGQISTAMEVLDSAK